MLLTVTSLSLVVLGVVMILSASSVASFARYGSAFLFFKKQLLWAVLGVIAFWFFSRLDYKRLKNWGYAAYAAAFLMLLAVLVPGVGVVSGGSTRWLGIGDLSFQPSELAKLALVLLAADVLSRKNERTLAEFSHTALPMLPALGILSVLVIMQPDLGTTLLLGSIGLGMLFVAGAPLRHLVPISLAGAGMAAVAALAEPYRRERVLAFLDPWKDPLDSGYQPIQSLIALGSGGWFGVGLGASRQKWSYVPNAHTDFIYAILGEEMGILGTLVVLAMFGFIVYLGIRIARGAPDRYGTLVASGITVWIGTQALVNIGAVTSALPITGVPLPLVSFGGTSLLVTLAALGILVNIGAQGRHRPRRKAAKPGSS